MSNAIHFEQSVVFLKVGFPSCVRTGMRRIL